VPTTNRSCWADAIDKVRAEELLNAIMGRVRRDEGTDIPAPLNVTPLNAKALPSIVLLVFIVMLVSYYGPLENGDAKSR